MSALQKLAIALSGLWWGACVYVALHFICKYW